MDTRETDHTRPCGQQAGIQVWGPGHDSLGYGARVGAGTGNIIMYLDQRAGNGTQVLAISSGRTHRLLNTWVNGTLVLEPQGPRFCQ